MKITFKELNILQKFLYNRVDVAFMRYYFLTESRDIDDEQLWSKFQNNQMAFFTDNHEEGFFNYVIEYIKKTGYKG